ncbi:hypothetical protein ACIBBE_45125 [Streptomyces sp. NPDC051644]|uniref:hypothetical protein n=1 Tax=Streptomyces sp. NPDC051644 TaxID=3365666 RepID=UPI003788E7D5
MARPLQAIDVRHPGGGRALLHDLVDLVEYLDQVEEGEARGLVPLSAGRDVLLQALVLDHLPDE